MKSYLIAAIWAIATYHIYRLIKYIVTSRRDAIEASRLGCQRAPVLRSWFPWGVDLVYEALAADRAKMFPVMAWKRCELIGATYEYRVMGTKSIFTSDPKNIQAILATQFNDFCLGAPRRGNFRPLLGDGIFTLDGPGWQHSRAMLRPQFAREQISDLGLEENHVCNLMKALPVHSTGWTSPIDLQTLFFRLTLDSACEFLFGYSPDSQLAALPDSVLAPKHRFTDGTDLLLDGELFARQFDRGQSFLAARSRLANMYYLTGGSAFRQSCADVHRFIDSFVRIALAKPPEDQSSAPRSRYVFLDALVAHTRDPIELRSQLINILLAGRDTTASLLGWTIHLLARHPDHYAALRATILADFGSYTAPRNLSFAALKACAPLQRVLAEILRLYPAVPVNSRRATRDTTIPRGGGPDGNSKVFIKKGDPVDYSVYVMHRRKEWWGDDANEFRPERWEGRKPGFEYLPFNGGPKICLGQQFSLTEASYVVVRLLQRFDAIDRLHLESEPKHNLTLTDSPAGGVRVRLHAA